MLKNKGITLIALVVTIVVLLILAGVSITAVFGENGIINGAQKAKEKTDESIKQEQEDVGKLVNQLEEFEREGLPDTVKEAIQKGTIFTVNKQIKDESGKTMTVPKGFKVKEEELIENGVVIADIEGNEFVWVSCENGEYKKYEYEVKQVNDSSYIADGENKDKGWYTRYYRAYSDWKDEVDETENKKSVQNNGGFYIARYEAGVPSNADFYVDESTSDKSYKDANSKDTTQTKTGENLKPVSKAGNQCWNLISQTNAKEVSGRMYSGETYGVRSQLIDGTAWDTVVTWMSKEYEGIEKDSTKYGNYRNSTGENQIAEDSCLFAEHLLKRGDDVSNAWCIGKNYQYGIFISGYKVSYQFSEGEETNYNNYDSDTKYTYDHYVEMATGASNSTKLKNIYDMAGNMYEWTTEYGYHDNQDSGTKYAVLRGGNFDVPGGSNPVSIRLGGYGVTYTNAPSFGFRVVLYVK